VLLEHRGREIKTTGDGFMACFDGPGRGIRCAQEIAARASEIGVEIRSGLHTGECEVRGDDIGGLAVHIAARIGALAGPGEVVVSGTVKDLVIGSGITMQERGQVDLRGVPGSWVIFLVGS
jgi:class 3 adenylate cyclase